MESLPLTQAAASNYQLSLLIPTNTVGLIIGKNGKSYKEIIDSTDVNLHLQVRKIITS